MPFFVSAKSAIHRVGFALENRRGKGGPKGAKASNWSQWRQRNFSCCAIADLCREFGISRKTGYKIFDRYQECGIQGLTDRSRRPHHYAHKLPFQIENYILNVKREHSTWGARKIRERLIRRFSGIKIPAKSTIHALLDRQGLSNAAAVHDGARKEQLFRWVSAPTSSGAPTIKESSY